MAMDGTNFVGVNTAAPKSQLSVQSSPIFNLNLIHNFGGDVLKSLISDDGNIVAILQGNNDLRLWTNTNGVWTSALVSAGVSYFDMTRDGQNVVYQLESDPGVLIYPSGYVDDVEQLCTIAYGGSSNVFVATLNNSRVYSFDGSNWNSHDFTTDFTYAISASDDGVYAVISNAYGTYQFSNVSGTWQHETIGNSSHSAVSMSSDGQVICEYGNIYQRNKINIYRNKILEFTFKGSLGGNVHYNPFLSKDGNTFSYRFYSNGNFYTYLYKYQNGQWVPCRPQVNARTVSLNYDASNLMGDANLYSASYSSKAFNVDDSLVVSNGYVTVGTDLEVNGNVFISRTTQSAAVASVRNSLGAVTTSGAISSTGNVYAYVNDGPQLRVYRTSTGMSESVKNSIQLYSISGDGNRILYDDPDNLLKTIDYSSGTWGTPVGFPTDFVSIKSATMSSDGNVVAVSDNGSLALYTGSWSSAGTTGIDDVNHVNSVSLSTTGSILALSYITSINVYTTTDYQNWAPQGTLIADHGVGIHLSGAGNVLSFEYGDKTGTKVYKYSSGNWALDATFVGYTANQLSLDGKVVSGFDGNLNNFIFYNTDGSTWINLFPTGIPLTGVTFNSSSLSATGNVFAVADDGTSNIYNVTFPSTTIINGNAIQINDTFSVTSSGNVSASYFFGDGSGLTNIKSSQWNTDFSGIGYLSNVGIGSASNPSSRLLVSCPGSPISASYDVRNSLGFGTVQGFLSSTGNVYCYDAGDNALRVYRWPSGIERILGIILYKLFGISGDGNRILYKLNSTSIYSVDYSSGSWGSGVLVYDASVVNAKFATMSSDGNIAGILTFESSNNLYIRRWNGSGWLICGTTNIDGSAIKYMSFSTDGKIIALAYDTTINIYTTTNYSEWTLQGTLNEITSGVLHMSGSGTVLSFGYDGKNSTKVYKYSGGNWTLDATFVGYGINQLSLDGKVVSGFDGNLNNFIFYNTGGSTWSNIFPDGIPLSGVNFSSSSLSATGNVFAVADDGTSNIYNVTLPVIGFSGNAIQVNDTFSVTPSGNVAFGGYVNSNLIPGQDNLYTLGTIGKRWKNLQLGPGTLYITDQTTGQQAGLSVNNGKLLIDNVEGIRTGNLFLTDIVTNVPTQLQVSAGTLLLNGIQGIRTGNVNFVDSQTGYQATMNVVNQVLTFSNVNTVKTSNVAFTDGTSQTTAYTKPTANVYPTSPTISSLTIDMSSSNSYIHCHCSGQLTLSVSNPRPAKQIQLFAYWGGGGSNYITTGGGWNTIATTGTNPYFVTKQFCVVTVTSMDYTLSNVFMVIGN